MLGRVIRRRHTPRDHDVEALLEGLEFGRYAVPGFAAHDDGVDGICGGGGGGRRALGDARKVGHFLL